MTDPTLTDEELAEMVADDPYDSTRTRKKLRTVAAALRASREEVKGLQYELDHYEERQEF